MAKFTFEINQFDGHRLYVFAVDDERTHLVVKDPSGQEYLVKLLYDPDAAYDQFNIELEAIHDDVPAGWEVR